MESKKVRIAARVIELAREGQYGDALNTTGKVLQGSKILIAGIAYKKKYR